MNHRALWLACTALTAFTTSTSQASDWTGANSTDWFTAGNWTAGVPTAGSTAIIAKTSPNPTVISGAAATALFTEIGIGAGAGHLTVSGAAASLTTGFTSVGDTGVGTLLITGGGRITDSIVSVVGSEATSNGTATVTGAGSIWSSPGIVVGADGVGALTIAAGGAVNTGALGVAIGSSNGTATVTGAGSTWTSAGLFVIGHPSSGTLNILNGGRVTVTGDASMGVAGAATGRMTVDGAGSTWTNSGTLEVGRNGFGVLTIANGGTVNAGAVWVSNAQGPVQAERGTINIGAAVGAAAIAPGTLNTPQVILVNDFARLTFNHTSANHTFTPVVTGPGLIDVRAGTTILTGTGSTANTRINGGTLIVNGTSTGSVLVSTGTLGGSGTVGATTVTGGTLSPGNSIGTLTVQGSLAMTSASTYLVEISPTGADLTSVTGTATTNGATVSALYAPGSYVARRYTILTAAGGVSGTFGALVNTNLPSSFGASLSYDPNNVFLNLDLLRPNFGSGLNGNQTNVANALVNSFNAAGGIPLAFGTLTPQGLTIVSGQAATGAQQSTFDAMGQFASMLTDPFIGGRGMNAPGANAAGYADEDSALAYAAKPKGRNPAEQDAYAAMARKAPPRAAFERRWSVWGAGYGGTQSTDGNATAGTANTSSRIYGGAAGFDYRLTPDTLIGFALGGGGTNYGLANDLGGGRSELFQAGIYGRHDFGPAYVAASLAYGWQDVTTDRNVFLNRYRAEFDASALTGRLETGYRFATGAGGLTPYAAGQFTTFWLPDYAEQTVAGTNMFALSYQSRDVTASRSELGLRGDTSFASGDAVITLRGRAAWAHNFDTDRSVSTFFQTLPASNFVVNGAAPARNAALVSAGAEARWLSGFSLAATFDGEFSNVTESYAGKGIIRYQW